MRPFSRGPGAGLRTGPGPQSRSIPSGSAFRAPQCSFDHASLRATLYSAIAETVAHYQAGFVAASDVLGGGLAASLHTPSCGDCIMETRATVVDSLHEFRARGELAQNAQRGVSRSSTRSSASWRALHAVHSVALSGRNSGAPPSCSQTFPPIAA